MKGRRSRRERLAGIVQTLQVRNAATIRELAGLFAVSEATVRRDLARLASEDIVTLVHSGAVLNASSRDRGQPRYSLAEAGTVRVEAKMRIGRKAASLLEQGEIVIVDSGSTTECLARSIPMDMSLTVLCFSLNVLVEVHRREKCRLVFTGGELHENTLMFENPHAAELIRRYRAGTAFISASGVNERLGVTCANHYEVASKRAAIQSSLRRILLADSSKFGRVQAAYFADLTEFDTVITDTELGQEQREALERLGVNVILA